MSGIVKFQQIGPSSTNLAVIPVTNGSVHHDLRGSDYAILLAAVQAGKPLLMTADAQIVYYRWSRDTSGGTVAIASTVSSSPANQAGAIYPAERPAIPEIAPRDALGLLVIAASATSLRIVVVD